MSLLKISIRRIGAVFVAALFTTQILFAYKPQANLWQDRRKTSTTGNNSSVKHTAISEKLFASLPIMKGSGWSAPIRGNEIASLETLSALPAEKPDIIKVLPPRVQAAFAPFSTVQGIEISPLPRSKVVYLLQDAHLHVEAQQNIAGTINGLAKEVRKQGERLLVGVEGSDAEKGDFSKYRRYPHRQTLQETAVAMMKARVLNGVEVAAIGYDSPINVVGVEQRDEYKANVEALRASVPSAEKTLLELESFWKQLSGEKNRRYTSEMKDFDSRFVSYQEGTLSVPDYAMLLDSIRPSQTPQLRRLVHAALMEGSLDVKKVEEERNDYLKVLLKTLTDDEVETLLRSSFLFKSKRLSSSVYYDFLKKLASRHKVPFSRYPELNLYVQYVIESENIDSAKLFAELKDQEEAVLKIIFKTTEQRKLAALTRQHILSKKLVNHSLTEADWNDYKNCGSPISYRFDGAPPDIRPIPVGNHRNGTDFGWIDQGTAAVLFRNLQSTIRNFEDFYHIAAARNKTMAGKLLSALERTNTQTAVLVAGGFHTEGLKGELLSRGVSVITLSPRISQLNNDLTAVEVLSSGRLPLDKIFEGDRLFLATPPQSMAPPTSKLVESATLTASEAHRTGSTVIQNEIVAEPSETGSTNGLNLSYEDGSHVRIYRRGLVVGEASRIIKSLISGPVWFFSLFFPRSLFRSIGVYSTVTAMMSFYAGLPTLGILAAVLHGCAPLPLLIPVELIEITDDKAPVTRLVLAGENSIGLWRAAPAPTTARNLQVDEETGVVSVEFQKLIARYGALALTFTRGSVDKALSENGGNLYLDVRSQTRSFDLVIKPRFADSPQVRKRFTNITADRFKRLVIPASVLEGFPEDEDITIAFENGEKDRNGLFEVRALEVSPEIPIVEPPEVSLTPINTIPDGRLVLSGISNPIIISDFGNHPFITSFSADSQTGALLINTNPNPGDPHIRDNGYLGAIVTGASVRRTLDQLGGLTFSFSGTIPSVDLQMGTPGKASAFIVRVNGIRSGSLGAYTASRADLETAFSEAGLVLNELDFIQMGISVLNHEGELSWYFLKPGTAIEPGPEPETVQLTSEAALDPWGILGNVPNNLIWGDFGDDPFITDVDIDPETGELLINTNPPPGTEHIRDTGFVGLVITGGSLRQHLQNNGGVVKFQFKGTIPELVFQIGTPASPEAVVVNLSNVKTDGYGTYILTESALVQAFQEKGVDFYGVDYVQVGIKVGEEGTLTARILQPGEQQEQPPMDPPVELTPSEYEPGFAVLANVQGNVFVTDQENRPFITDFNIQPPANILTIDTTPPPGREHIRDTGAIGLVITGGSVRDRFLVSDRLKFQFKGTIPDLTLRIGSPETPDVVTIPLIGVQEGSYSNFEITHAQLEAAFREKNLDISALPRFQFVFIVGPAEGTMEIVVLQPAAFYDNNPVEVFARAIAHPSKIDAVLDYLKIGLWEYVSLYDKTSDLINLLWSVRQYYVDPPLNQIVKVLTPLFNTFGGSELIWKSPVSLESRRNRDVRVQQRALNRYLVRMRSLFNFGEDRISVEVRQFDAFMENEDLAFVQEFPLEGGHKHYVIRVSLASLNRIREQGSDLVRAALTQGVMMTSQQGEELAIYRFLWHEIGEQVFKIPHQVLSENGLGPEVPSDKPSLTYFSEIGLVGALPRLVLQSEERTIFENLQIPYESLTGQYSPADYRTRQLEALRKFLSVRFILGEIVKNPNAGRVALSYQSVSGGFVRDANKNLALTPFGLDELTLSRSDQSRIDLLGSGAFGEGPRSTTEVFADAGIGSPTTLPVFDNRGGYKDMADRHAAFLQKSEGKAHVVGVLQTREQFGSDLEKYITYLRINNVNTGDLERAENLKADLDRGRLVLIFLSETQDKELSQSTADADVTNLIEYFLKEARTNDLTPQEVVFISDWRKLTVSAAYQNIVKIIVSVSLYVTDLEGKLTIESIAAIQA